MKIKSAALTDCRLIQEGHAVRMDLVDDKGTDLSFELPFEQVRAIAQLLPSLRERTARARGVNTSARVVLTLDRWTVEQSSDGTGLLLTLASSDGYEVCFDIPAEACRGLGLVLRRCEGPVIEKPIDRTAMPS
jgi:hypothetical protein